MEQCFAGLCIKAKLVQSTTITLGSKLFINVTHCRHMPSYDDIPYHLHSTGDPVSDNSGNPACAWDVTISSQLFQANGFLKHSGFLNTPFMQSIMDDLKERFVLTIDPASMKVLTNRKYMGSAPKPLDCRACMFWCRDAETQRSLSRQMAEAAKAGNLPELSELSAWGVPVDPALPKKPLWLAVCLGKLEAAQLLVAQGAILHSRHGDRRAQPIHAACTRGHLDVLQWLVEQHADVNATTVDGYRPLELAMTEESRTELTKFLITHGADVNANLTNNHSPLALAIDQGNTLVTECLLMHSADLDIKCKGDGPLECAIDGGHAQIVECLVTHGADVNAEFPRGGHPLGRAIDQNSIDQNHNLCIDQNCTEVVECLIRHGAEVNADVQVEMVLGCTKVRYAPLQLAIERDCTQVAKCLIVHGADVNATYKGLYDTGSIARVLDYSTPLVCAVIQDNAEIVQCLITHGAVVNPSLGKHLYSKHGIPLELAIGTGHFGIVECLITNGANVNAVYIDSETGERPLECAIVQVQTRIVEYLVKHSADVNAEFNDGTASPLSRAIDIDHADIAECLITHGAELAGRSFLRSSIESDSRDDYHALQYAIMGGQVEMVKCLVKHIADVNAEVGDNIRPLEWAIGQQHVEIAKCLITHNADVNAVCYAEDSEDGELPLEGAITTHQLEIVKCLIAHNADVNIGYRPLDWAIDYGYVEVLECLFKHGVDVNADVQVETYNLEDDEDGSVDVSFCKPLELTMKGRQIREHAETVECLIKHGADLNAIAQDGTTLLQLAASHGYDPQHLLSLQAKGGSSDHSAGDLSDSTQAQLVGPMSVDPALLATAAEAESAGHILEQSHQGSPSVTATSPSSCIDMSGGCSSASFQVSITTRGVGCYLFTVTDETKLSAILDAFANLFDPPKDASRLCFIFEDELIDLTINRLNSNGEYEQVYQCVGSYDMSDGDVIDCVPIDKMDKELDDLTAQVGAPAEGAGPASAEL